MNSLNSLNEILFNSFNEIYFFYKKEYLYMIVITFLALCLNYFIKRNINKLICDCN